MPLLSEVESKDDKFQDTSSVEELNTPKAEDEQVYKHSLCIRVILEIPYTFRKTFMSMKHPKINISSSVRIN